MQVREDGKAYVLIAEEWDTDRMIDTEELISLGIECGYHFITHEVSVFA